MDGAKKVCQANDNDDTALCCRNGWENSELKLFSSIISCNVIKNGAKKAAHSETLSKVLCMK